ncbi:MAG: CdaR family protein, partial [Clostridia bacterium]|nr:CdaR family protein [Clostridia bacterium]
RVVLNVEEYATVGRIPVVVELTGKPRPDLWVDTPRADPITVSVGGPRPLVDQVARVVAELDVGALAGDDRVSARTAVHFVPQDAAGNDLASPLLQVSSVDGVMLDRVNVDVSWYAQREIPLDVTSAVFGEPAEGFELVAVSAEPVGVAVAAPQNVLDELSRAFVEPIDITGAMGTLSVPARVRRMADARHVSMEEVVITAVISEQRVERRFRNLSIEVRGLPDDRAARLRTSRTGVAITGGYHWIQQLKDSDLTLYVNVSDLPPGEHQVPVQARAHGSDNFFYVADEETVTVTITQRGN